MRSLRTIAMSCCAAALLLAVGAPSAFADASFVKAWGWGVNTGAAQFETCTTSCRAGISTSGNPVSAVWYPMVAAVSPASGNILVSDSGHGRIQAYTPAGSFVRAFGSSGTGAGQLGYAWGVDADASGNVVVGDWIHHRISVFTESGTFVRSFGWGVSTGAAQLEVCTTSCQPGIAGSGAGQLNKVRDVALDGAGNVFAVDYTNNRVQVFTLAGAFVRSFGATGTGPGQMRAPDGIDIGPSGNVFVSDSENHRVDVFSATGTFVRTFGGYGTAPGLLQYPSGLAVDAGGRVVVSDNLGARLNIYTEQGAFLRSIGSYGTGAGQLGGHVGPAVDAAGHVFVADTNNHRIDDFRYLFGAIAPDELGLTFGAQTTGTTSSSMTLTVTNDGEANLSLSGIAITGADSARFSRPAGTAGGTCDTTTPLAPSATCTIKVVFAPTARGTSNASLTITGDSLAGTATVALSGMGKGPVVSFGQTSLDLGGQATGAAGSPVTVLVNNVGETPLSLSGIAFTGADSSQFSRASGAAGGTCDISTPVAANAFCTLGLVFTPASDGAKTATLSVSSDAPAGVASLALTGTGAQPGMALDQSELGFGEAVMWSSDNQRTVTVTNTSAAPLVFTSVALTGPDAVDFWGLDLDYQPYGDCTSSTVVPAGGTCLIRLFFTPKSPGAKTASLSITSNASPVIVPLSGTGTQSLVVDTYAPLDPIDPQQSSPPMPTLAKSGSPSAKARGTGFRVDPALALACPMGIVRCVTALTATAKVPVAGRKGATKKVVVGRASVPTREGVSTRLGFALTDKGARLLRQLGRLRLSVVAVTTGGNGITVTLSRSFAIKRPKSR